MTALRHEPCNAYSRRRATLMFTLFPRRWTHWLMLLVGPLFLAPSQGLRWWGPVEEAIKQLASQQPGLARAEGLLGLVSLLLLTPMVGLVALFLLFFVWVVRIGGSDQAAREPATRPRPRRGAPRPGLVAAADPDGRPGCALPALLRVGGPGGDSRAGRSYARLAGLGLLAARRRSVRGPGLRQERNVDVVVSTGSRPRR